MKKRRTPDPLSHWSGGSDYRIRWSLMMATVYLRMPSRHVLHKKDMSDANSPRHRNEYPEFFKVFVWWSKACFCSVHRGFWIQNMNGRKAERDLFAQKFRLNILRWSPLITWGLLAPVKLIAAEASATSEPGHGNHNGWWFIPVICPYFSQVRSGLSLLCPSKKRAGYNLLTYFIS